NPTHAEQRRVVEEFLAALRAGDFNALVSLLDPQVIVNVDAASLPRGMQPEMRGAEACARQAISAARGAKLARVVLINGAFGLVIAPRGRLFRAIQLTLVNGKIARLVVTGDPEHLRALDIALPAR
ncbi:MAG: RNA polymerase subunit sigma-70, partial [Terracidiphilus sp.]